MKHSQWLTVSQKYGCKFVLLLLPITTTVALYTIFYKKTKKKIFFLHSSLLFWVSALFFVCLRIFRFIVFLFLNLISYWTHWPPTVYFIIKYNMGVIMLAAFLFVCVYICFFFICYKCKVVVCICSSWLMGIKCRGMIRWTDR